MDRRCLWGWLNEVYRHPTVAFNTYSDEQQIEFAHDALVLLKEQETKTGKWIPIESTTGVEAFGVKEMTVIDVRCSVCGSEEDVSFTGYKYCPRCGAKMKDR